MSELGKGRLHGARVSIQQFVTRHQLQEPPDDGWRHEGSEDTQGFAEKTLSVRDERGHHGWMKTNKTFLNIATQKIKSSCQNWYKGKYYLETTVKINCSDVKRTFDSS